MTKYPKPIGIFQNSGQLHRRWFSKSEPRRRFSAFVDDSLIEIGRDGGAVVAVYPNLPDKFATKLLAVQMAADAEESVGGWLDASPYSGEEKKLLRKLLGLDGAMGGVGVGGEVGGVNPFKSEGIETELDRFDLLLDEVEVTIGEMRKLERDMRGTDDPSDRIAVMRAKTVLLEKWANLKSSVFSMREMAEFQQVVIDVLDKVLTVDQRNEFMNRIKPSR